MGKTMLFKFSLSMLVLSLVSVNMIEITAAQVDHDIAVISVTPSLTSVRLGELVNVTVIVENQGTANETNFNVTVYYDATVVKTKTVQNLEAGASTTLTFTWNTTGVREEVYNTTKKEKTYFINATASTVAGETETGDNTLLSPSTVTIMSYYITVIPQSTVDPDLTPGKNYTVSIYTDYNGSDIWSWQFELEYNPNVLHGGISNTDTWTGDGGIKMFVATGKTILADSEKVYVNETLMTRDVHYQILYEPGMINFMTAPGVGAEVKATYLYDGVVNGDLITTDKHPDATFKAGDFNNTLGKLWQTNAFFYYTEKPIPTTYGPGILANVTFTVVGTGDSEITIDESKTKLTGYNATTEEFYEIVSNWKPEVYHIISGYFKNTAEIVTHDLAVVSVTPNPTLVERGELVNVTVVVENQGTVPEILTVTAYYDRINPNYRIATPKTVQNWSVGASQSFIFTWDTAHVVGGVHTVIAVASTVSGELDTDDNTFQSSETVTVHVRTIYIRADGSIDPPTPLISTVDNITYTLTGDIASDFDGIVVDRNNIVVDGVGYSVQGTGTRNGITLSRISNVTIKNTKVTNFNIGIGLWGSNNITLTGNNVSNNGDGIRLLGSSYNNLTGNTASSNSEHGIYLLISSYNNLTGNTASSNSEHGIYLLISSYNNLTGNTASSNSEHGIYLDSSSNNTLFHNNLIDNTFQAGGYQLYRYLNTWDDGYPSGGNYWSDYTGVDEKSGPNQDQPSSDGIGDTAYVIDANNTDHYPLMNPWTPQYTLTIYSSPTGVTFTVDGVSHTTPWSGIYIEGASVSLVMSETHDGYVWSHWLEDGDTNRIKTVTMHACIDISLTAVFTQDTTPPTISIVSPENKTYTTSDVSLTFTVDEAVSWIGYSLDGQHNVTISGNTTLTDLSDGTHWLIVHARDATGNEGSSEMVYFAIQSPVIDATPPEILVTSPENKTYTTADILLTCTVDESVSWMAYNLDGQANTTITGDTTLSGLSDGPHSLIVYARDAAGNTGASDTIYFSLETQQPEPQPEPQQGEPLQLWIIVAIVILGGGVTASLVYFLKIRKPTEKVK